MKKFKKDATDLTTSMIGMGIGTAIGAGVAARVPAPHGAPLMGGFASMGSMMPMVATASMGGNAIRLAGKIGKASKKHKRR
jgi:hypothetical protein